MLGLVNAKTTLGGHVNARLLVVGLLGVSLLASACTDDKKGGGDASGQGSTSGSDVTARFFLPTGEPTNTSAPSVEVDASGGIHSVYPQYAGGGAFYAYCPASCSGPDQMKVVGFETDGTVHNAMLALDAGGRPQVLLATGSAVYYATPGASADVTDPASWSTSEILRHDGLREVTGEAFALDPSGRPRFIMHTYKAYLGVGQKPPEALFVACDAADCSSPDGWKQTKIADQMWRSNYLRYDANGVAKLASAITMGASESSSGTVTGAYVECASGCDDEANWHGTGLAPAYENDLAAVSIKPAISMALTKSGAPRIVMLGVTEFGKQNITYFACDEGCTGDGWRGSVLSDHEKVGAGLDLVLDANDHPRFVHTLDYNIALAYCDAADCADPEAKWDLSMVEASSSMKPDQIFLYDNCTVSAWFLHSPSLALTADGRPRIGYQARDISGGFGNPDPDRLRDCVAGTDMTWSRMSILPSHIVK